MPVQKGPFPSAPHPRRPTSPELTGQRSGAHVGWPTRAGPRHLLPGSQESLPAAPSSRLGGCRPLPTPPNLVKSPTRMPLGLQGTLTIWW